MEENSTVIGEVYSMLACRRSDLSMGSRWKEKGSKAKALEQPMSKTISDLQLSLIESNSKAILSGDSVLLEADQHQTHLLNLACFGRTIPTSQNDNQWFQLGLEEAFFLFHSLNCVQILINGCHSAKNPSRKCGCICAQRLYLSLRSIELCRSVAKTLLVIEVQRKTMVAGFPGCLNELSVSERTVTRWNPERSREEKINAKRDDHLPVI